MLFFKLFRKVDPCCAYCRHGTRISERDVVCLKHGAVPVEHHCRAFRYDPLKRTPPRPALLRLGGLGSEDFMLDAVPGQETLFAGMDAASSVADAGSAAATVEETPEMTAESEAAELETTELETPEGLDVPEELPAVEEPEEPEAVYVPEESEEPEAVYAPEEEETGEPPQGMEASEEPESVEEPAEEPDSAARRAVKVKVRAVKRRR